jgi:F-type H+-transporting ATPase subunit b
MSALLAASKSEGGTFLVTPGLGLMVWTLIAFGVTMFVLKKYAFPRIQEALDRRQKVIEDSVAQAERTRVEAEELLADYRARLAEARAQADEIVARAEKNAESYDALKRDETQKEIEMRMEQLKRDIDAEQRRAISEIRREVADLTIAATEKVTRKSLNTDDQRKLVEDALSEIDFSGIAGERG